ncbi:hypothetical protein [Chitinophaga barathri]|uniref:Tetratricopeptide repeat protein n=1 Tax=Chitinophaga barathri TaxID=1647451 RepID=A0A3N4M9M1_9BACT|nr:hypothetical protein [Chitinophaga barathri]RPD38336.1 hypothetical protein EG028_25965 [Chitinophaga barathri]
MTANRIVHHIFSQPDLRNVDQASLERLVETYPYFAAARVLLAQKQFSYIPDYNTPVFKKAQLYTSSPQYLYQLTMAADQPLAPMEEVPESTVKAPVVEETWEEAPLAEIIAEETPLAEEKIAEAEIIVEEMIPVAEVPVMEEIGEEIKAEPVAEIITEETPVEEPVAAMESEIPTAQAAADNDIVAKLEAEAEASLTADASPDPDALMETVVAEEIPVHVLSPLSPDEEIALEDEISAEDQAILDELEAEDLAAARAKATAEAEAQQAAEATAPETAKQDEVTAAGSETFVATPEVVERDEVIAVDYEAAEAEIARTSIEDEIVAVDYEAVEAEIARTSTEDEIVAVDYEAAEAEAARTSTEDEIVAIDYDALKPEEPVQYEPEIEEEEIVVPSETEPEGPGLALPKADIDHEAPQPEEPLQYAPEIEEEEIVVPSETEPEGPGLALPKADPEMPLVEVATDEDVEEAALPEAAFADEMEIPATEETTAAAEAPVTDAVAAETTTAEEEAPIRIFPMDTPTEETVLTFQPLYTEDYFAYKKLKDPVTAEKMTEKASAEMRSFTDWLRELKDNFSGKAAKDWYHQQMHKLYEDDDPEVTERVEKMAMQSITLNDDIVSETLAEIWVRQHQPEKAITIYQKLSLLNPGKNAYFAQRINELKQLTDNNK